MQREPNVLGRRIETRAPSLRRPWAGAPMTHWRSRDPAPVATTVVLPVDEVAVPHAEVPATEWPAPGRRDTAADSGNRTVDPTGLSAPRSSRRAASSAGTTSAGDRVAASAPPSPTPSSRSAGAATPAADTVPAARVDTVTDAPMGDAATGVPSTSVSPIPEPRNDTTSHKPASSSSARAGAPPALTPALRLHGKYAPNPGDQTLTAAASVGSARPSPARVPSRRIARLGGTGAPPVSGDPPQAAPDPGGHGAPGVEAVALTPAIERQTPRDVSARRLVPGSPPRAASTGANASPASPLVVDMGIVAKPAAPSIAPSEPSASPARPPLPGRGAAAQERAPSRRVHIGTLHVTINPPPRPPPNTATAPRRAASPPSPAGARSSPWDGAYHRLLD